MKKSIPVLAALVLVGIFGYMLWVSNGGNIPLWEPPAQIPDAVKTQPLEEREPRKPAPKYPLTVNFGLMEEQPGNLLQSLAIVAGVNQQVSALTVGAADTLELLLRLPSGIVLRTEGWDKTEEKDKTGAWTLWTKRFDLSNKAGATPETLLQDIVKLEVIEPGTNWIVTARATLSSATGESQGFGTIFVTRKETRAAFHATPVVD